MSADDITPGNGWLVIAAADPEWTYPLMVQDMGDDDEVAVGVASGADGTPDSYSVLDPTMAGVLHEWLGRWLAQRQPARRTEAGEAALQVCADEIGVCDDHGVGQDGTATVEDYLADIRTVIERRMEGEL